MILEIEAIELHRLASTIRNNGGPVLDLSTDSASCVFPQDVLPFTTEESNGKVLINGYYYDEGQTITSTSWRTKTGSSTSTCEGCLGRVTTS